jgi:hypothetical protein
MQPQEFMAFDIHLTIADDSPAAQILQDVIAQQHITPEEAASRLLNEAAQLHIKSSGQPDTVVSSNSEYIERLRERSARRAEHCRTLRP